MHGRAQIKSFPPEGQTAALWCGVLADHRCLFPSTDSPQFRTEHLPTAGWDGRL